MINPFSKVDMVKYSGRVVAVNLEDGSVIASAKEKRSIKYDKTKYTKVAILCLPVIEERPKLINRIAIVLDESGSMASISKKTVEVYNSIVKSIKEESIKNNQETTISFIRFGTVASIHYFDKPVESLKEFDQRDFTPNGYTALFDGVGKISQKFKDLNDEDNVSYLIYVITDGEENASKEWNASSIKTLIWNNTVGRKYSYVFNLPPNTKTRFCSTYGIPTDNVREWEATNKGMEEIADVTRKGFANFYNARSIGATQTSNFYVDADLSKVTTRDLNKLDDISSKVKIVEVPKECQIKEFVESKTKKPYVIGQGYYQLMKKELIQPQKSIAIFDKKTKMVYGGKQARKLLQLPDNVNAKVNPFDVGHYEIYCQSTSVNRKLSSHSKVLIDLNKINNDKPTWE